MPVFFYIDPAFVEDPFMTNIENIVLSYTFFKTGEELPEDPTSARIEPPRRGGFSSARSIRPASNSSSSDSSNSSSNSNSSGNNGSAGALLATAPSSPASGAKDLPISTSANANANAVSAVPSSEKKAAQ
jgi:hypothetical protein